jgi:hypothetical protein
VVARELLDGRVANVVDPRIADMPDVDPAADQGHGRKRGRHAAVGRVGHTQVTDMHIGLVERTLERHQRILAAGIIVFDQPLGALPAGDLAGAVTAHAVGDREEIALLTLERGVERKLGSDEIFIAVAHRALLAQASIVKPDHTSDDSTKDE